MDIYILDALLRPVDIVDEFISIIWTERYNRMGDFELVLISSSANYKRFVLDTMISIPDSKRVMQVKTVEETIDVDQGHVLRIKGYELTSILNDRALVALSVGTGDPYPYYNLTGWTPMGLLEYFFFGICVWGDVDSDDVIPFVEDQYVPGLYPPSNIPQPLPVDPVWSQKPASVYSGVCDVSDAYDIGFRLYKDPNAARLFFEAYTGNDRTTAQLDYPPVIFSEDMANLQNTSEYSDNTKHANVVRVIYYHKNLADEDVTTSVVVTDPNLDPSGGGFDRKVKILNVTSVPDDVVDLELYLEQLGQEELMRARPISVFDGEIDEANDFTYEVDYFLGDLVEVRGRNGGAAFMRVIEQIIKEDSEGKVSYPSLVTKTSINPGTWASWKYDVAWSAMGSEEYWGNQE